EKRAHGEGDAEAGARGAEEDRASWMVQLMPSRRQPVREPTVSIFPNQLRIGDRLTDADGEWEVASNPQGYRGGKDVEARAQRVGRPETQRVMTWPAYERLTIRRPEKK